MRPLGFRLRDFRAGMRVKPPACEEDGTSRRQRHVRMTAWYVVIVVNSSMHPVR